MIQTDTTDTLESYLHKTVNKKDVSPKPEVVRKYCIMEHPKEGDNLKSLEKNDFIESFLIGNPMPIESFIPVIGDFYQRQGYSPLPPEVYYRVSVNKSFDECTHRLYVYITQGGEGLLIRVLRETMIHKHD